MSKTVKEIYNHNVNRIHRLDEKINEFETKRDTCMGRIEKLILNWIKRNHEDWLEDVVTIEDEPWMQVTPHKDKIDVKMYKYDWDNIEIDEDGKQCNESGHYIDYTIKVSEL